MGNRSWCYEPNGRDSTIEIGTAGYCSYGVTIASKVIVYGPYFLSNTQPGCVKQGDSLIRAEFNLAVGQF